MRIYAVEEKKDTKVTPRTKGIPITRRDTPCKDKTRRRWLAYPAETRGEVDKTKAQLTPEMKLCLVLIIFGDF